MPSSPDIQTESDQVTLTPGQELYQASYDLLPFKDPARRYLILSPQRTGSNYLCRRLCNIKERFGLPSEYLHPKAIQMLGSRLVSSTSQDLKIPLNSYMRSLERARTTEDGWFGIKVQPAQLLVAVNRQQKELLQFVASFDRLVLMTRRDKLGQAISGAIAQQTETWFNDGSEPDLDDARIATLFPAISHNLARYIEEERMIFSIGKAVAKPLLRIEYEEIEENDQETFMTLVDFLASGQTLDLEEEETVPVTEKPPGEFASTVRKAFTDFMNGQRRSDSN